MYQRFRLANVKEKGHIEDLGLNKRRYYNGLEDLRTLSEFTEIRCRQKAFILIYSFLKS